MMRFLITLLLMLCLLLAGIYFLSQPLLGKISQTGLDMLSERLSQEGIEITRSRIGSVKLESWNAVAWRNASIEAVLKPEAFFSAGRELKAGIDKMTLRLESFSRGEFLWQASALSIILNNDKEASAKTGESTERLHLDWIRANFRIDFLKPAEALNQIRSLVGEAENLLAEGHPDISIDLSGTSTFMLGAKEYQMRIFTERDGEAYRMKVDRDVLEKISRDLEEQLTEDEIDVLSRNPVRVPRILKISQYARRTAGTAHQKNRAVPEDAYRHILWSFLLTKTFGLEFAKQVTDAHESTRTIGFRETTADHKMDLHNNAIGQRYALEGMPESQVLSRVLSDPDVMHSTARLG